MISAQTIIALTLGLFAVSSLASPPIADGYYAYPKYSYSYGVDDKLTGDHKTATETRDGGVVKGSYSLLQPDGVYRTVEYVADPIHGFQAKVINSAPGVHVAKKVVAAAPVYGGHLGGHHGGYGAVGAVVKPAAVAYTQSYGPGIAHGHGGYGGFGGFGHGGLGYGGYGNLGHGGFGHGGLAHGGFAHGGY